jgi:branched-chain amino acid transport system permease protein
MGVTIWSGLVLGSVYALIATGFLISMIPTGVFNFAQGAIVIGGSFIIYQLLSVAQVPAVWAVLLTIASGALVGLTCEVLTVRPLKGGTDRAIVTTVGASTVIAGLTGVKWGYLPLAVPFPGPATYAHVFGVAERPVELMTFGLAVLCALGLEITCRHTRRGQACLAVAEDRDAAMLRGVNVSALSLLAFIGAGAFGAITGILVGPITYAIPTLGASLALGGFVAVALGGEGSFVGGLVGGLAVGLTSTFAIRYLGASYGDLAVLALLLVTLAVRPKGMGGLAAARDV